MKGGTLMSLITPLILGAHLGSGAGSIYKFAEVLFGNKENRKKNLLIFTIAYVICIITFKLLHLI